MDKDSVAHDKVFYADWVDDIAPELDFTSTNNVAETQTVTMNMSDKGSGIAEVYFGLQNPEETEVVFTPCTSAQSDPMPWMTSAMVDHRQYCLLAWR